MGQQAALLIPNQLFHRQPASALNKPPFDLTKIKSGVQGLANIVQQIDSK